jgi:hypothetical protein
VSVLEGTARWFSDGHRDGFIERGLSALT